MFWLFEGNGSGNGNVLLEPDLIVFKPIMTRRLVKLNSITFKGKRYPSQQSRLVS